MSPSKKETSSANQAESSHTPSLIAYRPDIDGLRAVAVVAVMLYHAGIALKGGFVGVDIFFVISGFLITGLITRRSDAGQFSYTDFWHRRAKRILPAQLVVAFAVLLAGWIFVEPRSYAMIAETSAYQALFSSNIYFWQNLGYFKPQADSNPLLHFWSLAVEEQFYFVMPVALIPLWICSRRWAKTMLVAGVITSFALSCALTPSKLNASFYLLPTRAWEMLTGALLAVGIIPSPRGVVARQAIALAGLAMVVASVLVIRPDMLFPGWVAALPCAGAAAIIAANRHGPTLVGRALSWRPIVWIGLISYSLYLWHWPLLVFCDHYLFIEPPTDLLRAGFLILSVPIAWLSWYWVETPFRHQRSLSGHRPVFLAAGLGILLSLVASIILVQTGGAPDRYDELSQHIFDYVEKDHAKRAAPLGVGQLRSGQATPIGKTRQGSSQPDFVIWGDSHAVGFFAPLQELSVARGLSGYGIYRHGTIPLVGVEQPPAAATQDFSEAAIRFITARQPRVVIIVAKWVAWVDPECRLESTMARGAAETQPFQIMRAALKQTVDLLHDAGCKVCVVGQVPTSYKQSPVYLTREIARGTKDLGTVGTLDSAHRETQAQARKLLQSVEDEPGLILLDPASYLIKDGSAVVIVGEDPAYLDSSHLSTAGARLLLPMLETIF